MTFPYIRHGLLAILLIPLITCIPMQSQAETVQIEAGKMVLLHKKSQAEFTHDVHVKRGNFELFSDRLLAFYNDSGLERAEAFGNIKLLQGNVKGSANKAILNQKDNTITLIGNAVLEQDGNRLRGEKIIHNLKLEETLVLPAKGGRTHLTIESDDAGDSLLPTANKQP